MHIILGFLGTIVAILVLVNRLAQVGIDLASLNPFLWNRRRKWRKKYEGNPVYRVENPMDATAILMVAAVKADGDMTKEDKSNLLQIFEDDFKLSKKDAAGLLISSVHLLGDGEAVRNKIGKFLSPSKANFTEEQATSAMSLVARAAGDPDKRHVNSVELLQQVERLLTPSRPKQQTW